jgi:hypothetical protein
VDGLTGGYWYQDLGELWANPQNPRLLLPASGREAADAAILFLNQHDNLPGQFDRQRAPTVELEGPAEGLMEAGPLAPTAVISPTNYAVHYGRVLYTGSFDLSIVGPGSRQNVYIGDGSAVIGLKGGARDFTLTGGMIDIITEEEAWNSFVADPTIALADIPAPATAFNRDGKPAATLGYYEQPMGMGQVEFIPVWIFVADLLVDVPAPAEAGALAASELMPVVTDAYIYVPASAEDVPLAASIDLPAAGSQLGFGETVDLSGSATGGTAPYSYEWSSSVDGFLGAGATLNGVTLNADVRGGTVEPNVVTLTVLDGNSIVAVDTVAIDVIPAPLFLPSVYQE